MSKPNSFRPRFYNNLVAAALLGGRARVSSLQRKEFGLCMNEALYPPDLCGRLLVKPAPTQSGNLMM